MLSTSSESSKSSASSTLSGAAEQGTMISGIILSLKLGKKRRKTMNFTFQSETTHTPLVYIQIATKSIKMLKLHADSVLTRDNR
jgi:hypothetical protein